MSADLFAAFDDLSAPPQDTHHAKPNLQPPPFSSDRFLGNNEPAHPSPTQHHQHRWASPSSQTKQSDSQQRGPEASWGATSNIAAPTRSVSQIANFEDNSEEDDGWGDFEVAPSPVPSRLPSWSAARPSTSISSKPEETDNLDLQRRRIVRASTIDLMTNNLVQVLGASTTTDQIRTPPQAPNRLARIQESTPSVSTQPSPPHSAANADSNVLFDADDFEGGVEDGEDEDFGAFETVVFPSTHAAVDLISHNPYKSPTSPGNRASELLSGLNLSDPTTHSSQATQSLSSYEINPFPDIAGAKPIGSQTRRTKDSGTTQVTVRPSGKPGKLGDDRNGSGNFTSQPIKDNIHDATSNWDWDSIGPPQSKKPGKPKVAVDEAPITIDSSWNWDSTDLNIETTVESEKDGPPPINIPPPSVLLSIFPKLFDQADISLYKPVSGQPVAIRNRIMSDPRTLDFLEGYLALATVAARIIAGRKVRWHRDKLLTQSMSISAAGGKGMKLAGIDKAQAAREDREAGDVVTNWKEHIGRLRSAVAAANSSSNRSNTEQLKIPEISGNMPTSTSKAVPMSPKPCVVCGLKRNERISKVDFEVEDSFGEWWVEHWGHVACKRFWLRHEGTLRQR